MALSNFKELKQSVVDWSHRNDLNKLIDDFILMTEKDMFKTNANHESLDVRAIESTSSTAVSTKTFALPVGYLSMRSIEIQTSDSKTEIKYKVPDALRSRTGTGKPRFFTITSNIEFDITPDQSYTVEIKYFKRPDPLSIANPTNIVLTDNPDIYLFGVLAFLFAHAVDEVQKSAYYGMYSQAIDGANNQDKDGRYGPAPYARIEGSTP